MASSTIYVRNIPPVITNEELSSLFEAYGRVVSARVMTDKKTQRSHGYGFVEMASDEAADRAIEALHGAELEGQDLRVEPAKSRGQSPRSSYRSFFGRRRN
jgi:RNA recognition motif-containing protein